MSRRVAHQRRKLAEDRYARKTLGQSNSNKIVQGTVLLHPEGVRVLQVTGNNETMAG